MNNNNIDAVIRNATISTRNFSGRPGKYNKEGERSFSLLLDEEQGERMLADGWNVKRKEGRTPDDPPRYYLGVSVMFHPKHQPTVVLVTSRNKTILDETDIGRLDAAIFEKVDIQLNGRVWDAADGKHGVKAYLRAGYFTIKEDAFAEEYGMI